MSRFLVPAAFVATISGLAITFYFPRRRLWARVAEGRVALVLRAERYVSADRELADMVSALRARVAGG